MSLALLRYIAVTLGSSITASARPAATFLAAQLTVLTLTHYELADLSPSFEPLISAPAVVVAVALAVLEAAARQDPDIAAVTRDLQIDNITGALGALSAALVFGALGLPETAGMQMADGTAEAGGLLSSLSEAVAHQRSQPVELAAVGGALAINLGLTWLRSELLRFLDDFELGQLWARLETGGVVSLLILLPLLPLVVFGFLVVFGIGLGLVALAARAAARALDRRQRVPCRACDYQVRREASVCPECHAERTPTGEHKTGLQAALDALRNRREEPAGQ